MASSLIYFIQRVGHANDVSLRKGVTLNGRDIQNLNKEREQQVKF